MAYISLPLFVAFLAAEGSSRELGIAYALESAPNLLLGLFGGVLLDRLRIRWVMIFADIARAVAFGYLALIAFGGPEQNSGEGIGVIFVMAFVIGSFTSLYTSGLYTLIPSLVDRPRLAVANSRMTATENLASTSGPALAGLLISGPGYGTVFVVDAATFLVSAASIILIGPLDRPRSESESRSIIIEILNGLRYVWNELRLRTSTIALASANFVLGFIEATLVLAAQEVVGATEGWQQGVMFAVLGIGGIVGAVISPRAISVFGLGRTMIVGMIGFGVLFTLFVNSTYGVIGLTWLFLSFVFLQLVNVPVTTIRQVYTPSVLLGRVVTATRAVGWATLPLGALVGTAVADRIGFATATRWAPAFIIAVGLILSISIIWKDTFGPGHHRDSGSRSGRSEVQI